MHIRYMGPDPFLISDIPDTTLNPPKHEIATNGPRIVSNAI